MKHDELVRFYDATFVDDALQKALLPATNLEEFKTFILTEAKNRGFAFSRAQLDESFDGLGARDTFSKVDFGSPWISKIMSMGWVPKGYTLG
jgi:hypothetical protein